MNIMKELIYYATKAPSGHNSQPWKFKIQENSIEIHPDFNFTLPAVDPQNRELYISLGCAAENLCVSSSAFGYCAEWHIEKNTNDTYFLRIIFSDSNKSINNDTLDIIEKRQANRSVYNGKIVEEILLSELGELSIDDNLNVYYFKNGESNFSTLKDFIMKGNIIQMNDEGFKNELLSWIRFNKKHVEKTNNGLTYKVMAAPSLPKFIGKQIVKSFLTPEKQNKSDLEKIDSSSHFILLTTKTNCHADWIKLGMYLERLLLKLTRLGIASAYLNPPCELEILSNELKKVLPINSEYPTIILRIGYAKKAEFSPRKDIEKVVCE